MAAYVIYVVVFNHSAFIGIHPRGLHRGRRSGENIIGFTD